jgi:hypothetical protein
MAPGSGSTSTSSRTPSGHPPYLGLLVAERGKQDGRVPVGQVLGQHVDGGAAHAGIGVGQVRR